MKNPANAMNKKWNVGAKQSNYSKTGDFYNVLKKFPAAFFDNYGYVLFKTKEEYFNTEGVDVHEDRVEKGDGQGYTGVRKGISSLVGYVRVISPEFLELQADVAELKVKVSKLEKIISSFAKALTGF